MSWTSYGRRAKTLPSPIHVAHASADPDRERPMGYTIKIFGLTLDFNGHSSIAWSDPGLPGFALNLALDNAVAPKKLILKANGKVPLAEVDLDLTIDVTTVSSSIVLGSVTAKTKTSFALAPATSTTL